MRYFKSRLRRTLLAAGALLACSQAGAQTGAMSRQQILAEAEKMADVQLAQVAQLTQSGQIGKLAGLPPYIGWIPGVMWAGVADLSHVSSKTTYAEAIVQMGNAVNWTPPLAPKSPVFADNLCIGQAFLDAYVTKNDPARLAPLQSRLDAEYDCIEHGEPDHMPGSEGKGIMWWWCDALFMAPASHARLSAITGNPKYLEAMDKEWWETANLLYDKDEHLFFRDVTYIGKLTKNGKKVFWSRGNGWVFAGLARTLTYLPANYPSRARYVTVYRQMAAKLASLQQEDGTWHPSLLDPEEVPDSETSGTALDCFAFAWGINHGLLDRSTYLPVASKAWAALRAARRADGLLGYVQHVGGGPAPVQANDVQLYGTGAFLMSAVQLMKLAPISLPAPPHLSAAPPATATPAASAPSASTSPASPAK